MPKGLRVQVPPRAQFPAILSVRRLFVQKRWLVRNTKQSNQSEIARMIKHLHRIKLNRRRGMNLSREKVVVPDGLILTVEAIGPKE